MQKLTSNLLVSSISLLMSLAALVIVLGVAFDLPGLPNRPEPEPAKLTVVITSTPGPTAEPNEGIMNTAVAVAFNMFVQTQESEWTSTPVFVETPTLEATPTPVVLDVPTQTAGAGNPSRTTTDLAVNIKKLSQFRFKVPRDSSLYLRDTSGDGRVNTCTITKAGVTISVTLPANGAPSAPFRLPAGEYKLKCSGSNKTARITSS